ncbi:MAG TPA: prephenate dehydrogenase [Anaerolineaceae bacterium]
MVSDEPGFASGLAEACVAVMGLGLMGGSLALGLQGKCKRLLGIDPDPEALALAQRMGVVDEVSADGKDLLPWADAVILAAPVSAILKILAELPAVHPGRAVVMDLGSTKTQIMAEMQALPERFDPIGGHPMCGKEKGSLVHAEAALYQGAPFALAPLERTSLAARRFALEMIRALGACPVWTNPEEHDEWVASTSHLPYLLACALALATPPASRVLAGPGYRSTARLAATPAAMMLDVLVTNRKNILAALDRLQAEIICFRDLLSTQSSAKLKERLDAAADCHSWYLEKASKP